MTTYINSRYQNEVETIDEFETRKEAKKMLEEYQISYGAGYELWLSSRATKEWRNE